MNAASSFPSIAPRRAALSGALHIDLDGAWPHDLFRPEATLDARAWGPRLRYSATRAAIAEFADFVTPKLAPFTLFGSGDFHHLSALWLRRFTVPFTLVSFDNHPDWDIRPPRWCCGTWLNRALESPLLRRASIWGCGNFELNWPGYLFVSRTALRTHRLEVWPWTERLKPSGARRWRGLHRETWRADFSQFAQTLRSENVYVTVDLDCLQLGEAATNWEQGLFTAPEIAWALGEIRAQATIIGGDVCGAYSVPLYARFKQRIEATLDHPRPRETIVPATAQVQNLRAWQGLWPALTGFGGESSLAL